MVISGTTTQYYNNSLKKFGIQKKYSYICIIKLKIYNHDTKNKKCNL